MLDTSHLDQSLLVNWNVYFSQFSTQLLALDLSFYLTHIVNYSCVLSINENRNLMIHNWGQEREFKMSLSLCTIIFPPFRYQLICQDEAKVGGQHL